MTWTKREWQRDRRRRFVVENGFSMAANYGTGGQRKRILERDGYKCVDCGITDEQHRAKWSRPITIDHVDKNRRNNADDNLKTRCLQCHGRKDLLPRLRVPQIPAFREHIVRLRELGETYERIAFALRFSIGGVYKWSKKWGIV